MPDLSLNVTAEQVGQALQIFGSLLWPEFLVVVWLALVSMAILQLAKDITPFRRRYQRRRFKEWFDERVKAESEAWLARIVGPKLEEWLKEGRKVESQKWRNRKLRAEFQEWLRNGVKPNGTPLEFFKDRLWNRLIQLSAAGGEEALFSLGIEQVIGQINAGAQVVFEQPDDYPDQWLLNVFVSGLDPKKVRDHKRLLAQEAREPKEVIRPVDRSVRTLVSNQLQRNIDLLLIDIGRGWRFRLRVWAMGISAGFTVLLGLAVTIAVSPGFSFFSLFDSFIELLIWATVIIVSGYLAPAFHDVLVNLQGHRENR